MDVLQIPVWSSQIDSLFRTAPDVLIRLQGGNHILAHSAVLKPASPVLGEWIEEFLMTGVTDMDTDTPPASLTGAVQPPSPSPFSSRPSMTSAETQGYPTAFSQPLPRLVLPAEQDDPDAWRRVIALVYPDMRPATAALAATLPSPGSPVGPLSPGTSLSPTSSLPNSPSYPDPHSPPTVPAKSPVSGLLAAIGTSGVPPGAAAGAADWAAAAPVAAHLQAQQLTSPGLLSCAHSGGLPRPNAASGGVGTGAYSQGAMVGWEASSHAQALATWDDVDKVYRLAHKYCMQGVLGVCRARVLEAVRATRDAGDEDMWPPQPGSTGAQMQARYQARMRRAEAGLSMVDPTSPSYVLRWLALAVQHHDTALEQAILGIAKPYMPHLVTHHHPSGTAADTAFLHYWEALGHDYTLKHLLTGC